MLEILLLYVAGGANRHSIMNKDYAKLESLRKRKDKLTYKVFPNCAHLFMEIRAIESGNSKWSDHMDEVNKFALDWVSRN